MDIAGPVLFVLIAVAILWSLRLWDAARVRRKDAAHATTPNRCPVCSYDVRTLERCPECGLRLPQQSRPLDPQKMREDWPLSPIEVRQPGLHESLESIWSAPHNIAAELLIEQLRVRGVKASLMTEDVTEQIGGVVARYTKFSVGVYTEDLELAQHIVRRFEITDA